MKMGVSLILHKRKQISIVHRQSLLGITKWSMKDHSIEPLTHAKAKYNVYWLALVFHKQET